MSWIDVAIDSLRGAGELRRLGRYRSSVSRAYFAAFAGLTARLTEAGVVFGENAEAPAHSAVPDHISSNLPRQTRRKRQELKRLMHQLYEGRLVADYHASLTSDARSAKQALEASCCVLKILRIEA